MVTGCIAPPLLCGIVSNRNLQEMVYHPYTGFRDDLDSRPTSPLFFFWVSDSGLQPDRRYPCSNRIVDDPTDKLGASEDNGKIDPLRDRYEIGIRRSTEEFSMVRVDRNHDVPFVDQVAGRMVAIACGLIRTSHHSNNTDPF